MQSVPSTSLESAYSAASARSIHHEILFGEAVQTSTAKSWEAQDQRSWTVVLHGLPSGRQVCVWIQLAIGGFGSLPWQLGGGLRGNLLFPNCVFQELSARWLGFLTTVGDVAGEETLHIDLTASCIARA